MTLFNLKYIICAFDNKNICHTNVISTFTNLTICQYDLNFLSLKGLPLKLFKD